MSLVEQAGYEFCATPESLLESPFGKLAYYDAGDYPISSTAIRNKIIQQQDVSALLPQLVYEYIQQHQLYL